MIVRTSSSYGGCFSFILQMLTFQVIILTDGRITYSKFVYHSYMHNGYDYLIGFYDKNSSRNLTLAKSNESPSPELIRNASIPYRIDGKHFFLPTHIKYSYGHYTTCKNKVDYNDKKIFILSSSYTKLVPMCSICNWYDLFILWLECLKAM